MKEFFLKYGGTGLILLIVAGCVFFVVRKLVKDRRAGKSVCGCDCSACGGACQCGDDSE